MGKEHETIEVRNRIKADLLRAMKSGHKADVITLRTLIAAIDNAEAIPLDEPLPPTIGRSNDVQRKLLGAQEIQQILQHEVDEHRAAITEYARLGLSKQVETLTAAIELIQRYAEEQM